MSSLKDFAFAHEKYCFGRRKETEESFARVEAELQVVLPEEFKWFLRVCGYGECNAVSNLASCVSDTKRFRAAADLPKRFVVLDDRNDAGAILLDTESQAGAVTWIDTHALPRIATDELATTEHDHFPNFASWVRFCVEDIIDEQQA